MFKANQVNENVAPENPDETNKNLYREKSLLVFI